MANKTFNNLAILNWNADGVKKKRGTLIEFLQTQNIGIACVTETHLIPGEKFTIPGYKIERNDRPAPTASGGVAILIKKQLKHIQIPQPTLETIESVAIRVSQDNNTNLTIHSCYLQPNRRICKSDLEIFFENSEPTLLFGDLNSKNTSWGCRTNNPNGKRLSEIATQIGLIIEAPDEPTHYPYRQDHQPDILDTYYAL